MFQTGMSQVMGGGTSGMGRCNCDRRASRATRNGVDYEWDDGVFFLFRARIRLL
jgi:hypothetical protein